jgi:hypothetical protein
MPTARSALRRASPKHGRGGPRAKPRSTADLVLDTDDATLLDVVDNALTKGVVLSGDLTLALAQVDLVYARFSLLLCAADRVLPTRDAPRKHSTAQAPWGPRRRRRG